MSAFVKITGICTKSITSMFQWQKKIHTWLKFYKFDVNSSLMKTTNICFMIMCIGTNTRSFTSVFKFMRWSSELLFHNLANTRSRFFISTYVCIYFLIDAEMKDHLYYKKFVPKLSWNEVIITTIMKTLRYWKLRTQMSKLWCNTF